jgi:hypothetical protein
MRTIRFSLLAVTPVAMKTCAGWVSKSLPKTSCRIA